MKTLHTSIFLKVTGNTSDVKPKLSFRGRMRDDLTTSATSCCAWEVTVCFRVSKRLACCSVTFKETAALPMMSSLMCGSRTGTARWNWVQLKILWMRKELRKPPVTNHITVICLRPVNQTVGLDIMYIYIRTLPRRCVIDRNICCHFGGRPRQEKWSAKLNETTWNFRQHFNILCPSVWYKSGVLLATGCQNNIHDIWGHEAILSVTDSTSMPPTGDGNDRPGYDS